MDRVSPIQALQQPRNQVQVIQVPLANSLSVIPVVQGPFGDRQGHREFFPGKSRKPADAPKQVDRTQACFITNQLTGHGFDSPLFDPKG
jgi:hypothetical protein